MRVGHLAKGEALDVPMASPTRRSMPSFRNLRDLRLATTCEMQSGLRLLLLRKELMDLCAKGCARLDRLSEEVSEMLTASGERTRPRVQLPASRRKTLFGGTPNTTRGDAYVPQTYPKPWPLGALFGK